jgi:hypothetical protein
MALTQEETQKILEMKQSGASRDAVYAEIGRMRATPLYASPTAKAGALAPSEGYTLKDTAGDIWGGVSGAVKQFGTGISRGAENLEASMRGEQNPIASGAQLFAEVGAGVLGAAGELALGVAKATVPESTEQAVAEWMGTNIADPIMRQPKVQELVQNFKWLEENDPVEFRKVRALFAGAEIGAELLGLGTAKRAVGGIAQGTKGAIGGTVDVVGGALTTGKGVVGGTVDTIGSGLSAGKTRVTNTFDALMRTVNDVKVENARIRASDPFVGEAIKAKVPDPVINLHIKADDAQKAVHREIVDAYKAGDQEAISNTFSRIATEQYDIVDAKRESIGKQIGDTIQALPNGTVDFRPMVAQAREALGRDGKFIFNEEGKLLGTRRAGLSPQAEIWAKEIYNKLSEYEGDVTWKEMTDLDRLLGDINREAYSAGVTPPRISVINEAGEMVEENLTTYLRDLARNQIETVAPDLRDLNNEYRKAIQFQEALDATLFNAGRDLGISMDVGAPAQNRLRRIFSNAQTSEQYKAIARMLDEQARANGYTGANLELLTDFNLRVQPLYPETIKGATLPGGIREAVGAFIKGDVDPRKTQEALENLIRQTEAPEAPTPPPTQVDNQPVSLVDDTTPVATKPRDTFDELRETDPDMLKKLTRERGGVGKPSDDFLLKSARRELKKAPNNERLKELVMDLEAKEIVKKMNGEDFVTLEEYAKKIALGEMPTVDEMEKVYSLLETMGYKSLGMSDSDVAYIVNAISGRFDEGMKRIPVISNKADDVLMQEALKYKTVDEFVKGQGISVLHGTGTKFDAFDDSMRGSLTGAKSAKGAIWFTTDEPTARAYSVYSAEEGVVKKALDEADELEKLAQKSGKNEDWLKYDAKVAEYEELASYANTKSRREQANVKDVVIKGDLYKVDAKGKSPQELSRDDDIDSWLNEQLDKAKRLGKDGIEIKNLDDAVGLYNRPATHYAIFDSSNIKTRAQLEEIYNRAHGKTPLDIDTK